MQQAEEDETKMPEHPRNATDNVGSTAEQPFTL